MLLLCPYTAPDKFKDCFSIFKFFIVWTGLNIAHICKKLGHNLALNLIRKVWKNCLRILRSLSCAQSPVDLQETNPCGAECYTHVKVRSQLEVSKVIRDCHCFSLLRSVIGPESSHHFINLSDLGLAPIATYSLAVFWRFKQVARFNFSSLWLLVNLLFLWLALVIALVWFYNIQSKCALLWESRLVKQRTWKI